MTTPTDILLAFVGAFVVLLVAWRLASRRYTLPCPSWLGWLVEMKSPFAGTYDARAIVRHLELRPGMKVLDVGCGTGRVTIPIAEAVGPTGDVVAIDLQPGMLRRAQQKARAANLNYIRFLQVRAEEARLEQSHYDRAVLVTVLGEIPDREAAVQVIFDALKPGGILSITEIILDPHFQSRSKVLGLTRRLGFRENGFFGGRFLFTLNLQKPNIALLTG